MPHAVAEGSRRHLGALLETARAVSSSLQLEEVLGLVTQGMARLVGADRCGLWLLDRTGKTLTPAAAHGMSAELLEEWRGSPLALEAETLSKEALETTLPVLVPDAPSDPRTDKKAVRFYGDKTILVLPMVAGEEAQGTLFLNHVTDHHTYSALEIETAMAIANQAAVAIQNAKLHRETEQQRQQLLLFFREVGEVLASGLDLDRTLELVVDLAERMVRANASAIFLLDESEACLRVRALKGLPIEPGRASHLRVRSGMSWQVAQEGVPKLVEDLSRANRPAWFDEVGVEDLLCYLGVPLLLRGKVMGVLAVFGGRPGQFGWGESELLLAFANQAAVALENARLYALSRSRLEELAGLLTLSQSLPEVTDLEDVYRVLSAGVSRFLGANRCVLLLRTEGGEFLPQYPAFGLTFDELARLRLRADWRDACPSEGPCPLDPQSMLPVPCSMCWEEPSLVTPLRVQGRLIGAMLVAFHGSPGFGESQTRSLTILAPTVAAVVNNAVLYRSVEKERNQLDAVIGGVSDAVVIIDGQGRLVRLNGAAEALAGRRGEEVAGRQWQEVLIDPTLRGPGASKGKASLHEILEASQPAPYFETVLEDGRGEARDLAASYSVVPYSSGNEVLGVLIARDVSHLREVERVKSELISMVSHELRTPVGLIKGYASTLLNPQLLLDEQTRQRFLAGIDGSANRLGKLIENLLTASRVEAGLFKLSVRSMDLCQAVRNAVSTATIGVKQREVAIQLPEESVWIEGDSSQLELVLDNLLGNALKYSPADAPIRVELEEMESEVEVRVIDRGAGIAPEHLPRVFEKFYRVEGGRGSRAPGSGLGLYLCRSIVEAHGGRIWAESRPGEGSCFAFAIPRALPEAAASESPDAGSGAA